ncbi:hypothetical protein [Psychrobacillus sp. FJAT-21963]|uniref:hypothetical protein n=1 Tax=Psychrobacillus sp. FJAT-21963 TaxID=1712028 RepID=UPI0006F3F2AE|nr:hypothetical protein [Psychrobacillus sp. FJAT-21963]KQL36901.1 hypothetical protein AN959_02275 [Psychrobacillus sp. FJAT-21963]
MNNKTTKIIVATSIAASAFVAGAPEQQADASTNIEKLVSDAKKAGTVLKWAISIEGSADGVTQPWSQFNAAKTAIANVEAALKGVSNSDKLKFEAQLIEPKTQLQRAQGYLDAITASTKIEEKRAALSQAATTNNLEQVETKYHEMTAEFRKQTILLDRVYGQSTRDKIRNVVKGPAEQLINYLKNDVTVHMYTKAAAADIRVGKYQDASKKLENAQSIINSNVMVWESTLRKNIVDVSNSLPVQIVSISRVDNTTVTVKLNKTVSNIQTSEFSFDNSLTVTNSSLSKDGTTVTLTTTAQNPGIKYTLKYKGSSANFTVPGSIVPIQIGNTTTQYRETSEVLSLVGTFGGTYGSNPVRIDIPAGIKLLTINGIENVVAGSKSVNALPDKNGVITITFTANNINTPVIDKVISFNRIENNKVIETRTSAYMNFYALAKDGSVSNKKILFVNANGNYFITTDGLKYNLKGSSDIFKNEGIAVPLDTFKAALNTDDSVSINYRSTASSEFDITQNFYSVPLLFDSKFAYKSVVGYRMIGRQIELSGTGQPNYDVFIFKNTGTYLGKARISTSGAWKFGVTIDQNAINDFYIVQQVAGSATPTAYASGMSLRIIEGPFDLLSISNGATADNNLTNEAITFTIAPVKNTNGVALVQDQVVLAANATITVLDEDGTKAQYTNNMGGSVFANATNGFQIKFGNASNVLVNGKDAILSGPLDVVAIDGITNTYGLNLKVNTGFQVKEY